MTVLDLYYTIYPVLQKVNKMSAQIDKLQATQQTLTASVLRALDLLAKLRAGQSDPADVAKVDAVIAALTDDAAKLDAQTA